MVRPLTRALDYRTIRLDNWTDIHSFQHPEHVTLKKHGIDFQSTWNKGTWIFRGQSDVSWRLQSELERFLERCAIPFKHASEVEESIVRAFRRRLHLYTSSMPDGEDDSEFLALMRHHGAPTRLLDWTYSVYVAMYFALEKAASDCAVFMLNDNWLKTSVVSKLQRKRLPYTYFSEPIESHHAPQFRKVFMRKRDRVRLIAPATSYRLNERLTVQKGLFIGPGDVQASFEENLKAMPGWEENVFRLIVPREYRMKALAGLYEMGISRTTLFPGIDGFSSSLGVYEPSLKKFVGVPGGDTYRPGAGRSRATGTKS